MVHNFVLVYLEEIEANAVSNFWLSPFMLKVHSHKEYQLLCSVVFMHAHTYAHTHTHTHKCIALIGFR